MIAMQVSAMTEEKNTQKLLAMTARLVAAYVGNNSVPAAQLPEIIRGIYASLSGTQSPAEPAEAEAPKPAVPIRKSITPDYIICLEDGKKLKMLKRHLRTTYNMSPEEYRAKWNLAPDYPMVAPNYAARRSEFAKQIGLGRKPQEEPAPIPVPAPRKRGRGAKGKGEDAEM